MRRYAFIIGAALPLIAAHSASAEDVVIRIEAKRGAEAARTTAEGWGAQFPDVVTFPLSDGWIGIALGPMPREEATARLSELKNASKVPADSFLSAAEGRELTPVAGSAPAAATDADAAAADAGTGSPSTFPGGVAPAGAELPATDTPATDAPADPEMPAADAGTTDPATSDSAAPTTDATAEATTESGAAAATDPAPVVAEPAAPPAPAQVFIRIESSADRAKAEAQLAEYRKALPDAGLWALPNGRLAVALGPFDEAAGGEWLTAFKNAKAVPRDAFLTPEAEMGQVEIAGQTPAPGTILTPESQPVPMPALEDVQRALRWAGHYDGAIDGKDGPKTQAAIAEEIVRLRAAPDPAIAMAELIRRREAWRAEMGLTQLQDSHTGLSLPVPMEKLQFDRSERALSIYGPKNGSGAALILFSQPGGQQEMLDLAGLVTALGWVPQPERRIERGSVMLDGRNDSHIGHAEGKVVDGRVQGFVLIWPASDPEDQHRLAAEISDNLARFAPGATEAQPEAPAIAPATEGATDSTTDGAAQN